MLAKLNVTIAKNIIFKNVHKTFPNNFFNIRNNSTSSPDDSAASLREILRDIKQFDYSKITETPLVENVATNIVPITSPIEYSIYSYLLDPLVFTLCSIPVLYFGYKDSRNEIIKIRYYMSHTYYSNVLSGLQAGYDNNSVKIVAQDRLYNSFYEAMVDFIRVRIRLGTPILLAFIIMFFYCRNYVYPKYNGIKFFWIPDLSKSDPLYILPVILTSISVLPLLRNFKFSSKLGLLILGSFTVGSYFFNKFSACTLMVYILFSVLRTAKIFMFFPKPLTNINKFAFMRHYNYNENIKNSKEAYQKILEEAEKMVVNKNSRIFISKEKMDIISKNKNLL